MHFFGNQQLTQASWGTLLLLSLLAINIEAKADLETYFTGGTDGGGIRRYWPYRSDNNGCKDHVQDLESSYKEAAELIDAAVAAIAAVKQKPPPSRFGLSKDRWNWDRKAQTMTSMFGLRIGPDGGPVPEHQKQFTYVEGVFDQMKEGMDTDNSLSAPGSYRAPRNPGLYCGTDGWKFYQATDDDPASPGRKISDHIKPDKGTPQWPDGVWYFHYHYVKVPGSTATDNKLCGPRVMAFTFPNNNFITFCDLAWTTLAKNIVPGEVKRFDQLDTGSRYSLSSAWVHELAHFYGAYRKKTVKEELNDQDAVDDNGRPVLRPDGTPALVYGSVRVMNLAKKDVHLATHTADSYALFAVAMYLSDWNWSLGFAKSRGIL